MIFRRLRKEWFLSLLLACWVVLLPAMDARLSAVTVIIPVEPPEECAVACTAAPDDPSCCPDEKIPANRCCICFGMNDLNLLAEPAGAGPPALPFLEVIVAREGGRPDHVVSPPIPPPIPGFPARSDRGMVDRAAIETCS